MFSWEACLCKHWKVSAILHSHVLLQLHRYVDFKVYSVSKHYQ
jgi:hypothetical protein